MKIQALVEQSIRQWISETKDRRPSLTSVSEPEPSTPVSPPVSIYSLDEDAVRGLPTARSIKTSDDLFPRSSSSSENGRNGKHVYDEDHKQHSSLKATAAASSLVTSHNSSSSSASSASSSFIASSSATSSIQPDPFYAAIDTELLTSPDKLKDLARKSRDQRKGIYWHFVDLNKEVKDAKPNFVLIRDARNPKEIDLDDISSDHEAWYQAKVVKGVSFLQATLALLKKHIPGIEQNKNDARLTYLKTIFKEFYLSVKKSDGNIEELDDHVDRLKESFWQYVRRHAPAATIKQFETACVSEPSSDPCYPVITVGQVEIPPVKDKKESGDNKESSPCIREFFDARIPGLQNSDGSYVVRMTKDIITQKNTRNYYFNATGTINRDSTANVTSVPVTHLFSHSASVSNHHINTNLILPEDAERAADQLVDGCHNYLLGDNQKLQSVSIQTLVGGMLDREAENIIPSSQMVVRGIQTSKKNPLQVMLSGKASNPNAESLVEFKCEYSNRPIDTAGPSISGIATKILQQIKSDLDKIKKNKPDAADWTFLTSDEKNPTSKIPELRKQYKIICEALGRLPTQTPQQARKKRLLAAAALYKALRYNYQQQDYPIISTFLERGPEAQARKNYEAHLAALEAFMCYNQDEDPSVVNIIHITCKSGQRRTQLAVLIQKVMNRFYDITGSFLPDVNLETPSSKALYDWQVNLFKGYSEEELAKNPKLKKAFKGIAWRAIQEDVEPQMVCRGSINGNIACYPTNISSFPGYFNQKQLRKQYWLKVNEPVKLDKTFPSIRRSAPNFGDKKFDVPGEVLAEQEIKILEKLIAITLKATDRYKNWHKARFGRANAPADAQKKYGETHGAYGYASADKLQKSARDWTCLSHACNAMHTLLKDSGSSPHSLSQFFRREFQKSDNTGTNRDIGEIFLGKDMMDRLDTLNEPTLKKTETADADSVAGDNLSSFWGKWARMQAQSNIATKVDAKKLAELAALGISTSSSSSSAASTSSSSAASSSASSLSSSGSFSVSSLSSSGSFSVSSSSSSASLSSSASSVSVHL